MIPIEAKARTEIILKKHVRNFHNTMFVHQFFFRTKIPNAVIYDGFSSLPKRIISSENHYIFNCDFLI